MAFIDAARVRKIPLVLMTMCLGVLIAQVDTSIVNLALAHIGRDLHAGTSELQWVIDAYNLVYASLLLSGGTLGDLYGRRRVFAAGILLFILGSLVCAFAPDARILVAGRAVTGLGAALEFPTSLAILATAYPHAQQRTQAIGVWASCNGLAFVFGPTLGGLLLDRAGWRSMFLVVVPMGLLALALTFKAIPESAQPEGRRLAPASQALAVLALAALSLAVIEAPHQGWGSLSVGAGMSLFLAGALGFIWRERRGGDVLIPSGIFARPAFSAALAAAALMTFGIYAMIFLVPLYLQAGRGATALVAGLELVPMSLLFFIVSQWSGALAGRTGPRVPMVAGMALMGLGLVLLAGIGARGGPLAIQSALATVGIGLGLNTGPVLAVAVANAPKAQSGVASGLVNTARMIGATLGVAVLGALFATYSGAAPRAETIIAGMHPAFLGAAASEFLGAFIALAFIRADSLDPATT